MSYRERLKSLLVERSIELGSFTLASGARSSYYVDARCTTMSAEGQFLCGVVCLEAISDLGWDATHVGGLTMGADPLAYAIAHRSWLEDRPLDAFSVRKTAKEHGTGRQVEGGLPSGARVVVIEDSLTTGGSALRAVSALEAHSVTIAGVLTLVDRGEGAREVIEGAGYPLHAVFVAAELLSLARGDSSARP
jgi:orotate phosphoribosyltransferase